MSAAEKHETQFDSFSKLKTLSVSREWRQGSGTLGGHVLWIKFNRPQRHNALSMELVDEFHTVLDWLGSFPSPSEQSDSDEFYMPNRPRVVILAGCGKSFCVGADLLAVQSGMGGRQWDSRQIHNQKRFSSLILKLRRLPMPIVAAVHGATAGGGFSISLAADIRVAADTTKMHVSFTRLGLSGCELGSSFFLPRLVGHAQATEILMLGRSISAAKALAIGLVSTVVSEDQLTTECNKIADELLAGSPLGLELTKRGLNASISNTLEEQCHLEDMNQLLCLGDDSARQVGIGHMMKFQKKSKL